MKSIRVITSIQKSAVRRFFSEIGRSRVVFDLVNLKNASVPTTVRYGFPSQFLVKF